MGLGYLASRVSRIPANRLFLHSIVSNSHRPEPTPDLPPRTPVVSARVHFPNPDDVIKGFVNGYPIKIPKLPSEAVVSPVLEAPQLREWIEGAIAVGNLDYLLSALVSHILEAPLLLLAKT
ncbi:hypothetical protein K2173_021612 [Erythroxylum novogranatense]|uniref:Uncharacterized protein n=1 Tax=Erythroxylum novogranatense TaxID=1862640 RepID=A0AAV8TQQ1_9ROSI|nr:hypothetical protein K2173_021612 [Erythroxylum novogranatense]